ncbi:hypothetical protein [Pseudalkalibacillus sp. SCS-8]|uniref:hypothetical protein n=1 Tax=Pseudalkalibacillus nanhaiensis TaxID=3115291 RepID=UPI0032DBEB1A
MRMKWFIIITIVLLGGCSNEESFNKILQDDRIETLVHQEEVDHGVVLFYVPAITSEEEPAARFEARFIKKTLFGWEATFDRGGTSSGVDDTKLFSQYIQGDEGDSPFPLLFGEVTDLTIKRIVIQYSDGVETEAKTVQNNGEHFWFAFVDEPTEKMKYTITGFSEDGEVVETIEEESIH